MADQQPAAKPRSRVRLIVQAVFSLALVVVLFYYLLKDVDLAQVWAEIQAMARVSSSWPAARSSASSSACSRCHTPAACQSRSRRQQVMPEP
jgi:uncharacterized paraquat-inducible protein A